MSKILIENYRGIDIMFDNSRETFGCIINEEEKKDGNSFSAIKKFIDEYKKLNATFEPFFVIRNPEANFGGKNLKIVGIRKDGRFVGENEKGEKEQVSDYNEKDFILALPENENGLDEIKRISEEEEVLRKENNERRKTIISTLKLVTLRDYKTTIEQ